MQSNVSKIELETINHLISNFLRTHCASTFYNKNALLFKSQKEKNDDLMKDLFSKLREDD